MTTPGRGNGDTPASVLDLRGVWKTYGQALLLADEPSGALDSVNAEDVMDLLRQACQRGVAAVVVTHDAQLASWADRVVLLRDGRITGQTTQPPGPESLLIPGQGR